MELSLTCPTCGSSYNGTVTCSSIHATCWACGEEMRNDGPPRRGAVPSLQIVKEDLEDTKEALKGP